MNRNYYPQEPTSLEVIGDIEVNCCNCEAFTIIPCIVCEEWSDQDVYEALADYGVIYCDKCFETAPKSLFDDYSFYDLECVDHPLPLFSQAKLEANWEARAEDAAVEAYYGEKYGD